MGKQTYLNKNGNNGGFTLLEVLISIVILSVIISSAAAAFTYAARVSGDNKLSLTAMNLANDAVEYIRSLEFPEVGTKIIVGGTAVYGDPGGDILQLRTSEVDGVEYTIQTTISWEEQGGWELGDTDWDYKSVKVTVVPVGREGDTSLTKVIETYVTRDSTQPALTGANISLRLIRGWNTVPGSKVPVVNAKVKLTSGPSAPRQVLTSSAGVARFLDLTAGNYSVLVDSGSLGMILHPDQLGNWNISLSEGVTQTKEFEAEYPCSLKISLKDLNGNPIQIDPSITGSIKVTVPYGLEINKNFTSADIDSMGCLPQNFITGLWPVGDGYTGAYTITDISINECQYFGSYEAGVTGEDLWSGKFDSPGTCKNLFCYFGTIPITPSGLNTDWVDASSMIVSDAGSYTAYDEEELNILKGKFDTDNLTECITMPAHMTSEFNAAAVYFENTGTGTGPGLYIKNESNLILHTGMIIFRGEIEIQDTANPSDSGIITLSTTYEDGTPAPSYDGSEVGGSTGINYGKIYLAAPMVKEGINILEPGGYYYYDGLVLPDNASELIPITKDNYIN